MHYQFFLMNILILKKCKEYAPLINWVEPQNFLLNDTKTNYMFQLFQRLEEKKTLQFS